MKIINKKYKKNKTINSQNNFFKKNYYNNWLLCKKFYHLSENYLKLIDEILNNCTKFKKANIRDKMKKFSKEHSDSNKIKKNLNFN